jgi:hypothetical protein
MQSNQQLTTLLKDIGKQFISRNIDKYISYYKITENSKNKTYISTINYDGNLDEALKNVSQNIELKASYCLDDCYSILDLLNISYNQLLIGQAVCILINRGQSNLLKLTNDKNPESNISIVVDIDSVKRDLIEEDKKRNSIIYQRKILDWIWSSMIVGILLVAYVGIKIYRSSQ